MNNFGKIRKMLRNDLIEGFIMVVIFIALICVSMMLTSCASNDARPERAILQQPALAKSDKLNDQLFQKRTETAKNYSSADYKVGPDDLLEIEVFQAQELKTAVRVSSQGFIKLPIGDMIKAGGCTVAELESRISQSLKKFMVEPMVSVFVKEYKSQPISVLGYVKTPGIYFVNGPKTVLDLLSLAGGLTPEGADTCIIQRTSVDQNGKDQSENIVVDLNALLIKGRTELNIPIFSGDVIHVPRAGVFFVDGSVGAPGLYPLKGDITLVQALSVAKGINWEASRSGIKIYRDNGQPDREVISADYDAILAGKSKDIALQDKDIIIVGQNTVKSFIKGFAGTMNFGAFSMGKGY